MATRSVSAKGAPFNPSLAETAVAKLGLRSRAAIEGLVEQLIALLDAEDGDCELEDGDVDCCEAYDDRPGACLNDGKSGAGYDEDAEDDAPAEGRLAHRKRARRALIVT